MMLYDKSLDECNMAQGKDTVTLNDSTIFLIYKVQA